MEHTIPTSVHHGDPHDASLAPKGWTHIILPNAPIIILGSHLDGTSLIALISNVGLYPIGVDPFT